MAGRTLAGSLGLTGDWDLGENNWKDDNDVNLLKLSVVAQGVASELVSATPGAPTEGLIVLFDNTHPTNAGDIAVYDEAAWHYISPTTGWRMYDSDSGFMREFDGSTWIEVTSGGTPEIPHDFDARAGTGSATSYGGGVWFGNLITIGVSGFIDSVVYSLNTAEAGINATPVIYANNAGDAGALIAEGPTVADGALGDNVLPLDAPLAVSPGDVLWVGCYQANTGGIDATATAGDPSEYFVDTVPPNDPGGSLTTWTERLRIFARGREVESSVSKVQTEAGNYTIDPADMGNYIRLTGAGTKTVSIDLESTTALPANGEWHFRNVGAGNATIDPDVGVTVNPPADGTLVIPQGGTITLKRVAADEFDLLGQTVAA